MDDDNAGWTRILRVASHRISFLPSFLPRRVKFVLRLPTAISLLLPTTERGVLFLSFFAFADSRNSVGAEEEEAAELF